MKSEESGKFIHRWKRGIARSFSDRELILRTDGNIRFLKISKNLQITFFSLTLAVAGWVFFASSNYFIHDRIIEVKNSEILDARMVYRNLLSEVSDYQSKFFLLTGELEKNHSLMLDVVEKNAALQQNLQSTKTELSFSNTRQQQIIDAREKLRNKVSSIENEMRQLNTYNFELKGNLNTITTDLELALTQRNKARSESRKSSNKIARLENELENLHKSEQAVLVELTERTKENIADIEYVLGRTGLNVGKLVAANQILSKGQGGPFVEIIPATEPAERLKISLNNLNQQLDRYDDLQNLMTQLPITAPLDYFSIASHYGKRRDPINRRWAMHYGLDFGGVARTSVYSTAPGIVTYAGRKGKYGKFVEINHGKGFKTRYGHLYNVLVKRGQKVEYRKKIGLLGSSGRSTGPHLHYEVLYKGKPRNPWRFIKAGRYVYKKQ